MNRVSPLLFSALLVSALPCSSGIAADAKGQPKRELTTDRPDTTETPFTVEPGFMQLEMNAASWVRDRQGGVRTTEWEFAPSNLRVGLTPRTEVGLFFTPRVQRTVQPRGGSKETFRGVGDTALRGKVNFYGNDGGSHALGLIVDVTFATASNGLGVEHTEFGARLPLTFELGAGWDGAAMTVVERAYTDAGKYEAVWTNTLSVARDLMTDVGVFFEVVSTTGTGRHLLLFNGGATRRLGPNLQLDAGVNIGVSSTAPDLGVFAGLSTRF